MYDSENDASQSCFLDRVGDAAAFCDGISSLAFQPMLISAAVGEAAEDIFTFQSQPSRFEIIMNRPGGGASSGDDFSAANKSRGSGNRGAMLTNLADCGSCADCIDRESGNIGGEVKKLSSADCKLVPTTTVDTMFFQSLWAPVETFYLGFRTRYGN